MPSVKIENMNIIRANLNVLASFDGQRGLGGNGARKLHINTATGEFGTKDGLFQNFFQRTKQDSLLHADTIKTIIDMFESAIEYMNKTAPDKQPDETRKLLYRGFRGLAYLSSHYQAKENYNLLQDNMKKLKEELIEPLKNIIRKGIVDNNWFQTGVQINNGTTEPIMKKVTTFSQKDFLEQTMDGICYGICMDWCRRVLTKKAFSFTTSSKEGLIKEIEKELWGKRATALKEIYRTPDFSSEQMRNDDFNSQRGPTKLLVAQKISENKKFIQAGRYQKKGTYQALAQHTQKVGGATVSDKIRELVILKNDSQTKLDKGTHQMFIKHPILGIPSLCEVSLTDKEKDELRKTITQIESSLKRIELNKSLKPEGSNNNNNDENNDENKVEKITALDKAIAKFATMVVQSSDVIEIPTNTILCMSDPTDFQSHVTSLIEKCMMSMTDNTPKAFYLNFHFDRPYAGLNEKGGHALAFAKDQDQRGRFYAIDPNRGEFSSETIEGLIFIFSVILSYYSFNYNITSLEIKTVSLTGAAP